MKKYYLCIAKSWHDNKLTMNKIIKQNNTNLAENYAKTNEQINICICQVNNCHCGANIR